MLTTVTFDGRKLRSLREQAGITREAMALGANRGYSVISAYEVGRLQPPIAVAARLADLVGVPLDALLTRSHDEVAA